MRRAEGDTRPARPGDLGSVARGAWSGGSNLALNSLSLVSPPSCRDLFSAAYWCGDCGIVLFALCPHEEVTGVAHYLYDMDMANLKHHRDAVALLPELPEFSAKAAERLDQRERELGIRFPESVREWYGQHECFTKP